jgi:hypothetical protein
VRVAAILRVILYLILGVAAALGILAVRTYPAERTWADEASAWNRSRIHRNDWIPRPYRPECEWWRVGCRAIPTRKGPLAPLLDSALALAAELQCSKMPVYDGRLPREAEVFFCQGRLADTTVGLEVSDSGLALNVSRTWTPVDLDSTYAEFLRANEVRHGPAALCPQNDDHTFKENRRWQFIDRNTGIMKVAGKSLALDTDLGRIYCHTL